MRKILTIAAIAVAICANAQYSNKRKEEIKQYFAQSLNGNEAAFTRKDKIAIKEIDKARNVVWQCWKEAVAGTAEEKLPALLPAEARDTAYWAMPTHPEEGTRMPFHYIYKGEKPDSGYPLFLYMHGSGAKSAEWDTGYHLCRSFADSPSAYFIPQIPSENHYRWAIQPQQWAWEKLLRLAFLSDSIDCNRIYFFGISEGGYGSQRLASFYADYLAGAGPMAGGEPLQNAPCENLANTAFSLRTGERDYGFGRNYLTYVTNLTLDSLQAAHPGLYNHKIEIVPGMGHGINYETTTPWLAQFKRNPHLTYFYWENYEMYGRKRKGFYNLRADEEGCNEQERVCYEMSISDNTVTLNVNNVTYRTTRQMAGIPMTFHKTFTPATKGKVTIFLNEKLVDLKKPVKVIVNGKEVVNKKVKPTTKAMAESCALFNDPERLFPAAVQVTIE